MKMYDCFCRYCGHLNRHMYLEETEGWMECEICGHDTKDARFISIRTMPVLNTGSEAFRRKEHFAS